MESVKIAEKVVQNLLLVMPNWHSKLVRPFRDTLHKEMSLETYYCLETLKMSGPVTMKELACLLKVPKQQVTKLVDTLGGHRFIERVQNEEDRRSVRICLTDLAIAYLDDYYLKNTDFIRNMEAQLTDRELDRLNDALETLGELLPKLK